MSTGKPVFEDSEDVETNRSPQWEQTKPRPLYRRHRWCPHPMWDTFPFIRQSKMKLLIWGVATVGLARAMRDDEALHRQYELSRELCCNKRGASDFGTYSSERLQKDPLREWKKMVYQVRPSESCEDTLSLKHYPDGTVEETKFDELVSYNNGVRRPEDHECLKVRVVLNRDEKLKREFTTNYLTPFDFEEFSKSPRAAVFFRFFRSAGADDDDEPPKTVSTGFFLSRTLLEGIPDVNSFLSNYSVDRTAGYNFTNGFDRFRRALEFVLFTSWFDDNTTYDKYLNDAKQGFGLPRRANGSRGGSKRSRGGSR